MTRPRREALLALAVCVACGLLAAPANGAFHLMKIREVSGAPMTAMNTGYIELQMYEPGQNLVSGHNITFWDADGVNNTTGMPGPQLTLPLSGANPPNGESQRTILIGDSGVAGRDFTLGLSGLFVAGPGADIVPAGAVCFEAIPVDCVSWGGGTFTGAANLPDGATPFGTTLPNATALNRRISPGCPTQLDLGDDTNNSAVDFVSAPRAPRNNATPPTETLCAGAAGDSDDPQTKIKKRPKNRSEDDSPTFKFRSDEPGSTFKCKLDKKKFRGCKSPKTYRNLDPGPHTFKVKATDVEGNVDKTAAKDRFKVLP